MKILYTIATLVFISLAILIIRGGIIMHKENKEVLDNCNPTEMYIIGNKGHKTRVYDCTK